MIIDRSMFKHIGTNVIFDEPAQILGPEHISIDDNVHLMHGIYISSCGKQVVIGSNTHFAPYAVLYGPLTIGKHCAIAAHVVLASVGHGYDRVDIPMVKQPAQTKEIVLEDDVWIGANAVVVGGVRIGTGSIVGAGAVVTKDVPPFSVVGGVPARVIRDRRKERK
jgi:acetyltransferase-like isoleucine patch superfamily enzyme